MPTKIGNFTRQASHLAGSSGPRVAPFLMGAIRAALSRAGAKRFRHDALEGARAAAAFRAAAEAAVNLSRGTWQIGRTIHRGADILVGQHVAGTNDHAAKAW